MRSGPTLRGRQCRIATCTTHSMSGKAATRPSGKASSHQLAEPSSTRPTTEATRNVAIIGGLGWRQNSRQAPRSDRPARRRA